MAESMYVVSLEGEIRVQRAEEIRAELQDALTTHEQVFLNVSHVSDIDLSFVHLLYAARRFAKKKNRTFRLTGTFQETVVRRLQTGGFLAGNISAAARDVDEALLPLPE
ncbi:MAG: STAS domain-containing protein [Spirochaetaceae bacterium]